MLRIVTVLACLLVLAAGAAINTKTSKFGFVGASLSVAEQEQNYVVEVGFLSGSLNQQVSFSVELELNTAGINDVVLLNSGGTVPANSEQLIPIAFRVPLDKIAQETDETFTLRLSLDSLDSSLLGEFSDALQVTILDRDVISFQLSEEDYGETENAVMPVRITRSPPDVVLANPVTFSVTPLTVEQALEEGVITDFPNENLDSPNRATEADFDTTVLTVTFPADEAGSSQVLSVPAPILVVNDELNEAPEQFFIVHMELEDAINTALVEEQRTVATCAIQDNDDIEISFTQGVYEFAEPESDTFYKIKIVKNRETEQTIYVGVLVSEPFSSLTPAQLYSPETADSADYRVSSSGNTFTLIFFLSHDESTNFSFRLLADTREESVEGFQATILPVEQFPPGGLTPTNGYSVYIPGEFSSAEVRIVDSTGPSATPITASPSTTSTTPTTTTPEPTIPATTSSLCPEVEGSLYFELNGVKYPSGSHVTMSDIGAINPSNGAAVPGASLVCVTSEVNSKCCRNGDGGNIGEWFYPDGSKVPRNSGNSHRDFTRSGYTHQVRLNRRNGAMGPLGTYTCVVPREDGCEGLVHTAVITLDIAAPPVNPVNPTPTSTLSPVTTATTSSVPTSTTGSPVPTATVPVAPVNPVPVALQCSCEACTWSPPLNSPASQHNYEIRYYHPTSGKETTSTLFGEESDVSFRTPRRVFFILKPTEEVLAQVRVKIFNTEDGPWTEPVNLC